MSLEAIERSRALWNRSRADLDSDEIRAQCDASARALRLTSERAAPSPQVPRSGPPRLAAEGQPACAMCGGPWRDLGHCKGVCLRCGFTQSCADTL